LEGNRAVFKFKQFTIHQEKCGMKVAIDSCIFGASIDVKNGDKILDIGTGTGLLSLMLAQKADVQIDAVEIDQLAYYQAKSNISDSPFDANITIHHIDIKEFNGINYDLIIVNPPFFEKDLNSPNSQKNKAKHQSELTFEILAETISAKLSLKGRAAVLLPPTGMAKFVKLMSINGLYLSKMIQIKHQEIKAPIREIAEFSNINQPAFIKEFCIKGADNVTYTKEFQELMKEYYIIF
jgi:tRNA1Val (adenine37-N6)-methyltransferase